MVEIELESIAFRNPTRVRCKDRVLETQKVPLEELVELWKWYFNIPPFEKICLTVKDNRLYGSMKLSPVGGGKNLLDLFTDLGIEVKKVESKKAIRETDILRLALDMASRIAFGNKAGIVLSDYYKRITTSEEYAEYFIYKAKENLKEIKENSKNE